MSRKIYISPSSQWENTYAAGNTNEAAQCRRIGLALSEALSRCGFETMVGSENSTMYTRVAQSNVWGADLHVPVHTNAFNQTMMGTRLFCYDLTGEGYKASKAIFDCLAPVVPGESDGIRAVQYYEITRSNAPCAYVEAAFHDNEEQAQWIIDHVTEIAEAICKGICKYFETDYISPDPEPEVIYRVYRQVGSFINKEYAERMADSVKSEGYDAIVVEVDANE